MPLVLDATVGGANANSYCTAADADAYFAGRAFSSNWTSATTGTKEQALVHATSLLDREKWLGAKGSTPAVATTQALAWPRRWAPTLEFDAAPQFIAEYFIDLSVAYYSSLVIPTPIVRATCELALEILNAGATDPTTRDTTRNIKRESVGPISTEYFDPWYRVSDLGFFPSVIKLIAPLLRSGDGVQVERA